MMMPGPVWTTMQLPSLYFRVKTTGKYGKASEPHPNGTHFRFEFDIRWYSLDEVEPVTEKDYEDWRARLRAESRKANAL